MCQLKLTPEQLTSLRRRFFAKVKKTRGCWLGLGKCRQGYPEMMFLGVLTGIHRWSWIIHYGPIPMGKQVLHKCDNRRCGKPTHLFLGTHLDNMADKVSKGRHPKGMQIPWSKLSNMDVISILKSIAASATQTSLASKFNVALSTINDVHRGITWKHIHRK